MSLPRLLPLLLLLSLPLCAQIKLKVGDLTLSADGHAAPFCVQIPIMLQDTTTTGVAYTLMTFTLELGGDTGIINGSVADNMLVAGGFLVPPISGLSNPGVDMDNGSTATCATIHNQATEGFPALGFAPGGTPAAFWTINNNGSSMGYKVGTFLDVSFNNLSTSVIGEDQLIAILEIPIIANPGEATLTISPVGENVVDYTEVGGVVLNSENLDVTEAFGTLRFCPQTLASQPADATACPGDDVSFSVNVTGTGPFSYQWYHEETLLPGANSATLMLTNISPLDLGDYSCEITSACATVRSAAGTLSIGDFVAGISPPGFALGLSIPTLNASTECGVPVITYEWEDSGGTVLGNQASLTLDPPPLSSEVYTLTVSDGDDRTLVRSIPVLVNPLGLDLNGDGFNTPDDLWLVLPSWRSSAYDADGDGAMTVLDMLYINVGEDAD